MFHHYEYALLYVFRRIGGLESEHGRAVKIKDVFRRIGGLENKRLQKRVLIGVFRRIGGLETRMLSIPN